MNQRSENHRFGLEVGVGGSGESRVKPACPSGAYPGGACPLMRRLLMSEELLYRTCLVLPSVEVGTVERVY